MNRRLPYNKRNKRLQIEKLLGQVKKLMVDTQAKADERATEFPCEAGTLSDCAVHLNGAALALGWARDQLS